MLWAFFPLFFCVFCFFFSGKAKRLLALQTGALHTVTKLRPRERTNILSSFSWTTGPNKFRKHFFYTSDRGSTALRSKQDSYAKCSPHKRNREQHLEIIHDDKLISPNNNSILFVCVTFLVTAPLACKVQRSLLDGDAFRFSQNPFKQPIKWFVSAHSICECSHP